MKRERVGLKLPTKVNRFLAVEDISIWLGVIMMDDHSLGFAEGLVAIRPNFVSTRLHHGMVRFQDLRVNYVYYNTLNRIFCLNFWFGRLYVTHCPLLLSLPKKYPPVRMRV